MKSENLTAWALNELSAEEQAQLEAELHADPAAQEAAESNKEFCTFLTRELRDDALSLTPEQRAHLVKAPASKVLSAASAFAPKPLRWWQRPAIPMAAAAAVIVMGALAAVYLPEWTEKADEAQKLAAAQMPLADEVRVKLNSHAQRDLAKSIPPNIGAPLSSTLAPQKEKAIQDLLVAASHAELGDYNKAVEGFNQILAADPQNATALQGWDNAVNQKAREFSNQLDQTRARMTGNLSATSGGSIRSTGGISATVPPPVDWSASSQIANMNPVQAPVDLMGRSLTSRSAGEFDYGELDFSGNSTGMPSAGSAPDLSGPLIAAAPASSSARVGGVVTGPWQKTGAGNITLNGGNTYTGATALAGSATLVTGDSTATTRNPVGRADVTVAGGKVIHLERSGKTAVLFPNQEDYAKFVENPVTSVAREPLSTFSIDVDTASYANVRRFLNINTKPPREAVRIEELINYFPSSEPAPASDAKQSFAVTVEMATCPWQPQHRLTRINLKGRDVPAGEKPSNLVFLVDVSGSMDAPEKLPLVQRSLRMLADRLGENDHVAMVTYAGGTRVVLPSISGTKKAEIMAAIDELTAGGSTHGSAGIKLAYEQAVGGFIKGGVNRVILCTDGDFNVGISSPKELEGFITEKARSGVFLSVLGFGTGNLKDRNMVALADKGNGNYAYIDSVSEARKVLVEQMQGTLVTIAKDVKIQVEFNPAIIREYRLIGYEKRLLAKEDFNDDTKDAGEIGSGHSITALYELIPANLLPGTSPPPLVDKLKYQTTPEPVQLAAPPPVKTVQTATNEALTVKLRYKEPDGTTSKLIEVPLNDDARALEKASAEFKFTAAVAGFGMLLRESSYSGSLTWDNVRTLAREGKGSDTHGYRGEFLQLIEKAAAGK